MSYDTTASPAARRTPRWAWLAVLAVVVAAVCAAGVAGFLRHRADDRDNVAQADIGDCVAAAHDEDPPYRLVSCDDLAAEYVVLTSFPADNNRARCHDVPGASLLFTVDEKAMCLGEKGVDPKTAVNVAKEGDCLFLEGEPYSVRDPKRLDCADPEAIFRVLKRLSDVSKLGIGPGPCAAVPGTVRTYSWNWRDLDPAYPLSDLTIDVVLCLGAKNPPAPRHSPGPDDAGSPCHYVSAAEMSATVTTAAGRTYTVRSRSHDPSGNWSNVCVYYFTSGKDEIRIEVEGPRRYEPGTRDETLTVAGFPAIYGPGEGNRVLTVFHPVANVSVIVWLGAAGDSLAKKIAIALFAVVQPRLGS